ncbi:TetR family transcriptional regulator [Streptomyces abyssalis]|uniref:TetR family transcriptional regulator n=1 Tax=Streptomyces abyssalis TaxID=933944 RepID=A0A1E7JI07_9ACTN|nr:TetR/AcrR family transcriptional regulator [Streptomyces abyssalis]OEU86115.1 TetR family transcriptional regulator [Streptomyces abyssalis]OEU92418.1 TetR family transcriptional regulator [Streptomyces abyssalis]
MSPGFPDTAPTPSPSAPRDRLLATASALFYAEGIHAVGVERLITQASVTRATFYRHFGGKEELVTAYVEAQDAALRAQYEEAAQLIDEPAGLLRALVGGISETVCGPGFRGCPFINAAAEYPDPATPVHRAVLAHRTWFRTVLLELLAAAGHSDPPWAARRLVMIRDGAMVGGYLGERDEVVTSLATVVDEVLGSGRTDMEAGPG